MKDKIIFGQYVPSNSWIHKLDPRTKLISLGLLIISLFLINNIYTLIGFIGFVFILVLTTKIPVLRFFRSFKTMTSVLIFTFFMQILFHTENDILLKDFEFNLTYLNLFIIILVLTLWVLFSKHIKCFKSLIFILILALLFTLQHYFNVGPSITSYNILIYKNSLIKALFLILRLFTLLVLSALLTLTTKPTDLNNGLEKLLKPLSKLGINTTSFSMIISIALRFIPTLILEADKILKAQASRGADFKDGNLIKKVSQAVSLIIPMFIIAYKKAYELGNAMEARGYIESANRSSLYELKYKKIDYISYSFICLITVLLVVNKILWIL
jgi:energy-coupling factor transport system permease protein